MTLNQDEAPTQAFTRMQRELAHVSEQARVAHAMAMDWRQRCLASEAQCRRLQRKYQNLKRKKGLEHEAKPDEDPSHDEALSLPQVW